MNTPAKHTKNPLNLSKGKFYFQWERDDVLKIIVERNIAAKKAVELGCSGGQTGTKIKQALGIDHYIGVELDGVAAKEAADRLDEVHVADLQKVTPQDLGINDGVDLLVALDVLEHLVDPWDVLARWAAVISPGGYFVTSIPNVQNISVITGLVQGDWEYASAGLLDATHLRFFTLKGIHQLLEGAGLNVVENAVKFLPQLDLKLVTPEGNKLTFGNLTLSDLTRDQVIGLFAFQYIAIGQKPRE